MLHHNQLQIRGEQLAMTVLSIENTTIEGNNVTVEAIVDDAICIYKATYSDPAEYAPGLCVASFQLADEEQIPTDEDGFCSFLTDLDLEWTPVDTSDYND